MSSLHSLNLNVPENAPEPMAPTLVPGYFSFTRKKFNRQAGEWYYLDKVIPEEIDYQVFKFRQGTVHQFYNTVNDTVLYCYHRWDGKWLRLSANQVVKLSEYFARKAHDAFRDAA